MGFWRHTNTTIARNTLQHYKPQNTEKHRHTEPRPTKKSQCSSPLQGHNGVHPEETSLTGRALVPAQHCYRGAGVELRVGDVRAAGELCHGEVPAGRWGCGGGLVSGDGGDESMGGGRGGGGGGVQFAEALGGGCVADGLGWTRHSHTKSQPQGGECWGTTAKATAG